MGRPIRYSREVRERAVQLRAPELVKRTTWIQFRFTMG